MCAINLHAISYGVACFFARCWKLCFVCSCSLRGRRLRLPPSASFQAPFLSSLSTPILEDQNRQMQKRRRRLFLGLEGKVASTKTNRKKSFYCYFLQKNSSCILNGGIWLGISLTSLGISRLLR